MAAINTRLCPRLVDKPTPTVDAMKRGLISTLALIVAGSVGALVPLMLLASAGSLRADSVTSFETAMKTTSTVHTPPLGSPAEQQGIMRFENFLSHLDEQTARDETEKVYAPDAYFNDTIKTLHGSPAIRDYLIKTAHGLDSMSVRFDDVAVSGKNFYFRWTMDTRMKNLARGKTIRTIGVTLVRFDPQGRVILHQDFWDSAQGVWDHVPVLGTVIRWIRQKI